MIIRTLLYVLFGFLLGTLATTHVYDKNLYNHESEMTDMSYRAYLYGCVTHSKDLKACKDGAEAYRYLNESVYRM